MRNAECGVWNEVIGAILDRVMRKRMIVVWGMLAILLMNGGLLDVRAEQGDNIMQQFQMLQQVFGTVREHYVDEIDMKDVVEGAIEGVLARLDPHSSYLSPRQRKEMTENFQGSFEGIGIHFDIISDTLTVISPIEGSPAYEVGLHSGDKIVRIDGKTAIHINDQEVKRRLKGPEGTSVEVTVKKAAGGGLVDYAIERRKVPIVSVPYAFMLRPGTGYIWLRRFSRTTGEELEEALRTLEAEGMEQLILDLRWNGGGLLEEAAAVSDKFLRRGELVVYTEGRGWEREDFYAESEEEHPEFPLIVMINHWSASASEIVSGAVQDLDRGLVVGQTSFGKGLVQRPFALANQGLLLLTVARYHTPLGRLIQRPYGDRDREQYVREAFEDDTGENPEARVYRTAGGREVYGGGGIRPDIVLEPDSLTAFERRLLGSRVFFTFASRYVEGDPDLARLDADDREALDAFVRDFEVPDRAIEMFQSFLTDAEVDFTSEAFDREVEFLRGGIKREIAGILWGPAAGGRVRMGDDPAVLAAAELFEEAARIMHSRTVVGELNR